VVPGDVKNLGPLGGEVYDFFDDLEVFFRKIAFPELPDIYDVPVEDKLFRIYAVQVREQFAGMATISAKVNIRYDDNLYFALFQGGKIFCKEKKSVLVKDYLAINYL